MRQFVLGLLALVLASILATDATAGFLTFAQAFGSLGTGNGQFQTPTGVAVTSSGRVWVADSNGRRIEEFDSAGTFQQAIGFAAGRQLVPTNLAVDASGDVWVSDTGNSRVLEFNSAGIFVSAIAAGLLNGPDRKSTR